MTRANWYRSTETGRLHDPVALPGGKGVFVAQHRTPGPTRFLIANGERKNVSSRRSKTGGLAIARVTFYLLTRQPGFVALHSRSRIR
jgi:hypothetical protein